MLSTCISLFSKAKTIEGVVRFDKNQEQKPGHSFSGWYTTRTFFVNFDFLTLFEHFVIFNSAIQLKNTVNSKEELTDTHTQNRWFIFTEDTRSYIKENSLIALGVDKKRPSLVAGFVSYIACVELPRGLWPTCIEKLIFFITDSASSETIRETSLETIAFICQEIAVIFFSESNLHDILSSILMYSNFIFL